jgi:hypothetical protein
VDATFRAPFVRVPAARAVVVDPARVVVVDAGPTVVAGEPPPPTTPQAMRSPASPVDRVVGSGWRG